MSKEFGLQHISTGEIFRREMNANSELGMKIYDLMVCGSLVPDEIAIEVIQRYLKTTQERCLLDGFPRSISQARFLYSYLSNSRERLDRLIVLDVPDDVIFARAEKRILTERRPEDRSNEVLRKRLALFRKETTKAIDFFEVLALASHVDGSKSVDEVFEEIKRSLQNGNSHNIDSKREPNNSTIGSN